MASTAGSSPHYGGKLLRRICGPREVGSLNATVPPDGRARIVVAGADGSLRVWDAEAGTLLHTLTAHTNKVNAVAAWTGSDGRARIVSASADRSVMVWAMGSAWASDRFDL